MARGTSKGLNKVIKRDALLIGETLSGEYVDTKSEAAALSEILLCVISRLVESGCDWIALSKLEGVSEDVRSAIAEVAEYQVVNDGNPPIHALYDISTRLIESRTIFDWDMS